MRKKDGLAFLLAFLLVSFGFTGICAAEENDDFQISPLRYDWVLTPGEEKSGFVKVINNIDDPINAITEVEDFSISEDLKGEAKFFIPDNGHPLKAYDVINWIKIDKELLTLAPHESKKIPFTLVVPAGTPTGGYYGTIFFKRKLINKSDQAGAAQVNIDYRLGALLTLSVKGAEPAIEAGELKLFETSKKIYFDKPTEFAIQAANTGNIPYKAVGTIDIFRFGKKAASIEVAQKLLYPNRIRVFDPTKWNFSLFDFGMYTANLHLASEDGSVSIDGTTSFFVFPWKTIVIILGIILLLVGIFFLGRIGNGKKKKK